MIYDPLAYWPAHCFRGVNHCPTCLERKPCPCDAATDVLEAAEATAAVAPPEEPPADPQLSEPVRAIEQMDLWETRKDIA